MKKERFRDDGSEQDDGRSAEGGAGCSRAVHHGQELYERLIEALDRSDDDDDDEEEEEEEEDEDMGPHYKEWDDKRLEVCARMGMPRECPYISVRGCAEDRSDSEDESPPTAAEMTKARVILATEARMKASERAMKFAQGQHPRVDISGLGEDSDSDAMPGLGEDSDSDAMDSDDDDGGFFFFNTANGNAVVMGLEAQIDKATDAKKPKSTQFDELSMLTYAIHYNNMWFNDNEFWEEGDLVQSSCEKLATAWKKLLAHTDEELGIDPEFTRPGIEALLENFDEMLNDDPRGLGVKYPFQWRP